jgi:hypothetical protein
MARVLDVQYRTVLHAQEKAAYLIQTNGVQ